MTKPPPPPPPKRQAHIKKRSGVCPACREDIHTVGHSYCPHCGAPLTSDFTERRDPTKQKPTPDDGMVPCRVCEENIARGAKTCPKCGVGFPGQNIVMVSVSYILVGIFILYLSLWVLERNGFL